jgi:hypothetical protein
MRWGHARRLTAGADVSVDIYVLSFGKVWARMGV